MLYFVRLDFIIIIIIITLRHNSLRDLLAELLEEICKDVVVEPPLLPLTGENQA